MRWPWQRRADDRPSAPEPPSAPAPAGWRFLPPLQRTLGPIQPVSAPAAFPGRLAAWSDPSFVGPSLGSGRRLDGPSGVIELDPPERRSRTVVSRSLAQPAELTLRTAPSGLRSTASEEVLADDALDPDPGPTEGPGPAVETAPSVAPDVEVAAEPIARAEQVRATSPTLPRAAAPIDRAGAPVAGAPVAVAPVAVAPIAQRIEDGPSPAAPGSRGTAVPGPARPTPLPVQRAAATRTTPRTEPARGPIASTGGLPLGAPTPPAGVRAVDLAAAIAPVDSAVPPSAEIDLTGAAFEDPSVPATAIDVPGSTSAIDRRPLALPVDGPGPARPLVQRSRRDAGAAVPERVTGMPDVVDAVEVRAPRSVTGADARVQRIPSGTPRGDALREGGPSVVQRETAARRPVRPSRSESRQGPAPAAATPESFVSFAPESGGTTSPGSAAPEPPLSLEPLEPLEPLSSFGSATVVDLPRPLPMRDAAAAWTARSLQRLAAPAGTGAPASSGDRGRRPAPTLRIGMPIQVGSAEGPSLQRLPVARSWTLPDTGAASAPPWSRPTGRFGAPVPVDDPVVQREESAVNESAPPPPTVPADVPPAGGVPAAGGAAPAAAAAPPQAPASREDLDKLAASLMPSLLWRLKAELVTERERRGVRSDRW